MHIVNCIKYKMIQGRAFIVKQPALGAVASPSRRSSLIVRAATALPSDVRFVNTPNLNLVNYCNY